MKSNDLKKRKSGFNPNRECYISEDGKYLCYVTTDLDTRRPVTLRYEIGQDGITEELTFLIDDMNHEMDLNDRYESELRDSVFDAKVASYNANPDDEDAVNPWDTIADKDGNLEDILFAEEESENLQVARVRRIIDESCTETQQDFLEHFGKGMQLEKMCQAETEKTGKLPSSAAMTNKK